MWQQQQQQQQKEKAEVAVVGMSLHLGNWNPPWTRPPAVEAARLQNEKEVKEAEVAAVEAALLLNEIIGVGGSCPSLARGTASPKKRFQLPRVKQTPPAGASPAV